MSQTPALTSAAATRDAEESFGQKDVFLESLRERLRRGKEKQNLAKRYRPGLAPTWVDSAEGAEQATGEAGLDLVEARRRAEELRAQRRLQAEAQGAEPGVRVKRERRPVVAEVVSVSQLRGASPDEGLVVDTSQLQVQELPSSSDSSRGNSDAESSEDDADRRRARARARANERARQEQEDSKREQPLRQQQQQQQQLNRGHSDPDSDQDSDSDSDSESEESSDDSDGGSALLMLKPTFIPKNRRVTMEERERQEAEERAVAEEARRRKAELKAEATQAALDDIQRRAQRGSASLLEGGLGSGAALAATSKEISYAGGVLRGKDGAELVPESSTEEDSDDDLELDRWKVRELQRLSRDKQLREREEEERAETLRRRGLSDREIAADNARLGLRQEEQGSSSKMQFMQRYYHKGAFFADENEKLEIFQRDYSAPTGEDKDYDKSSLPEVMQVKNWGKRGRTKYTHLVDQDTSDLKNNPWASRISRQTSSKFNRFGGERSQRA